MTRGDYRIISPTPKTPIMKMLGTAQISLKQYFSLLQERTNILVNDEKFQHFIRICIILNSLTLGIEHHDQPDTLTRYSAVQSM